MGRYDSAWKDIIEAHFKEFVEFYFPDVASELDFSQPVDFLEQELQKLNSAGEGPGRVVDLLARVHSRIGPDVLLFCHVEVQGKKDLEFQKRLFQIGYRIFDRFDSMPITLVILTDPDPDWYPDVYEVTTAGRYLRVEFNVAKLVYYRKKMPDLKRSGNPFAFVTEVLLEETRYRRSMDIRKLEYMYNLKKRLAWRLFRRGFNGDYIWSLLRFLDWILQLPKELEKRLRENIDQKWGGETMSYITSWERIAEEKGHLEEKQEVLIRLISIKYQITDEERALIQSSDENEKLDAAIDAFPLADSKDEVLQKLQ